MSNTVVRVLTALVGIPAVVGLLYLGGWSFTLLVLALALLAQHELYRLLEEAGARPNRVVGLSLGALLVLQVVYAPLLYGAAGLVVIALAWSPFDRTAPNDTPGEQPARVGDLPATLFGVVYPSALFAFLLEIRFSQGPQVDDTEAFYLTLAVLVLVWSTDTLAYFVGRTLGKRPLAPAVSPKKTWAGAVGGAVGAVVAAILLKVLVLDVLSLGDAVALGLLAGVVGQLGDLAESKLKRQVGVKDSGSLLPGHGGLLDRFDAMILVAPAVYLYLRFASGLIP